MAELYVALPQGVGGEKQLRDLKTTLVEMSRKVPISSALIPSDLIARFTHAQLQVVVKTLQSAGIATLLEAGLEAGDALAETARLMQHLDADGLHLDLSAKGDHATKTADLQKACDLIGQDYILGVDCGCSRHLAMMAGEQEADYVGFSDRHGSQFSLPGSFLCLNEIVQWWVEIFEPPCVAFGVETKAQAKVLSHLGCDFVAPGLVLWEHATGAPNQNPVETLETFHEDMLDVHNV